MFFILYDMLRIPHIVEQINFCPPTSSSLLKIGRHDVTQCWKGCFLKNLTFRAISFLATPSRINNFSYSHPTRQNTFSYNPQPLPDRGACHAVWKISLLTQKTYKIPIYLFTAGKCSIKMHHFPGRDLKICHTPQGKFGLSGHGCICVKFSATNASHSKNTRVWIPNQGTFLGETTW